MLFSNTNLLFAQIWLSSVSARHGLCQQVTVLHSVFDVVKGQRRKKTTYDGPGHEEGLTTLGTKITTEVMMEIFRDMCAQYCRCGDVVWSLYAKECIRVARERGYGKCYR